MVGRRPTTDDRRRLRPLGSSFVRQGAPMHPLSTIATGTIEGNALGVNALGVGDLNGDDLMDYMLTAAKVTVVGRDFGGVDVGWIYFVPGACPIL